MSQENQPSGKNGELGDVSIEESNIIIRQPERRELEDIVSLQMKIWGYGHGKGLVPGQTIGSYSNHGLAYGAFKETQMEHGVVEQKMVGFIFGYYALSPEFVYYLHMIGVDPDNRGLGIGTKLFLKTYDRIQEDVIRLESQMVLAKESILDTLSQLPASQALNGDQIRAKLSKIKFPRPRVKLTFDPMYPGLLDFYIRKLGGVVGLFEAKEYEKLSTSPLQRGPIHCDRLTLHIDLPLESIPELAKGAKSVVNDLSFSELQSITTMVPFYYDDNFGTYVPREARMGARENRMKVPFPLFLNKLEREIWEISDELFFIREHDHDRFGQDPSYIIDESALHVSGIDMSIDEEPNDEILDRYKFLEGLYEEREKLFNYVSILWMSTIRKVLAQPAIFREYRGTGYVIDRDKDIGYLILEKR